MRRFVLFVLAFCAIVVLGVALPHSHFQDRAVAAAQLPENWHASDCSKDTNHWSHWSGTTVCQMRRTTLALPSGHLSVNTVNGGINVSGEDRSDVALEARVRAWGPSEAAATNMLNSVSIDTANGDIRDHGPHISFFGLSGYTVDYTLHVPHHLVADFHTMNGGIQLASLDGTIRFDTTNGGVGLSQLNGDVQGNTTNGGLHIDLSGNRWQGPGLHASTTNGGISVQVPDNYSAHLETSTVNGGISVDFPISVHGEIKNHLDTDLGNGGATLQVETINGGVSINRSTGKSASED